MKRAPLKNLTLESASKRAEAIAVARQHTELLLKMERQTDQYLDVIERQIRLVRSEDSADDARALDKIVDRFQRVRELRNMAEVQSWTLEISRELDKAWKRLPW